MEREGLLTCFTQAFTCAWPEPDESIQQRYVRPILIILSISAYVFQVSFSTSFFLPKSWINLSFSPYMVHAPLIVFSFGIVLYWNRKTEMEGKLYSLIYDSVLAHLYDAADYRINSWSLILAAKGIRPLLQTGCCHHPTSYAVCKFWRRLLHRG
jgi:hypothetical protein